MHCVEGALWAGNWTATRQRAGDGSTGLCLRHCPTQSTVMEAPSSPPPARLHWHTRLAPSPCKAIPLPCAIPQEAPQRRPASPSSHPSLTMLAGWPPSRPLASFPITTNICTYTVTTTNRIHFNTEYFASLLGSPQIAPRASIFRRDQGGVANLEDLKRLMRYNDYKNDPVGWNGRGKQRREGSDAQVQGRGFLSRNPNMSPTLSRVRAAVPLHWESHDMLILIRSPTPFVFPALLSRARRGSPTRTRPAARASPVLIATLPVP